MSDLNDILRMADELRDGINGVLKASSVSLPDRSDDADRLSRLKQRLDLQVRRLDLMHEWLTIHMSRLDDIYRRLGMEFKD